jgi:hypothetical protein
MPANYRTAAGPASTRQDVGNGVYTAAPHSYAQVVWPPRHEHGA